MLSVRQAAAAASAVLGRIILPSTVYGWISTGKLPSKKVGGMRLVDRAQLDLFLSGTPEMDRQSR